MNKNTKVEDKSTELVSILKEQFQGKLNLARIKFLSLFIVALCKVQTVNFEKLSSAFNSTAKASSSHRRIQRFIGLYNLCPELIVQTGSLEKLTSIFSCLVLHIKDCPFR
jgi:hypothetical protein